MKNNFKKVKRNGGAAMLVSIVFFLFISLSIIAGLVTPSIREFRNAAVNLNSKKSYFLAESGSEDVAYRLLKNMSVGDNETLILDSNSATTTVTNILGNIKEIISLGNVSNYQRKANIRLSTGSGASFNFGVQSGNGGFILENTSSVTGNVYSSGSVVGAGNTVRGDAVSAGATGLINGIHTTGSAYAHNIRETSPSSATIIDKDAYYVNKDAGVTVIRTSYPGSPDQPVIDLPISDAMIASLEADALAEGIATCSGGEYKITDDQALGPIKIPCDLEISGDPTVTLGGTVWVKGNIVIKNTAVIQVSVSLGNQSVAIIADNVDNRTTSSSIDLQNTSEFHGSGSPNSFVFLISQNNSAELGGNEDAISMANTADGESVILYAGHGLININNSAVLKEVTGYKIKARNSATIVYDSGLANTIFTSGPGGGYQINDWKEIK